MKKLLLFAYITSLGSFFCHAQKVTEATVKVGNREMPGFTAQCRHSSTLVQEAIMHDLEKAGVRKHKKKKQFYAYHEITLPQINEGKIDLFCRVHKKGKRARVYFVVSRGYDNYVSVATDPVVAANVTKYLSGLDAVVDENVAIQEKGLELQAANEKLEKEKADVKKAEDQKKQKEKEMREMTDKQ